MNKLGINIDHVATLRNARGTNYPSLVTAAGIAEQNGGDFITVHLREDRRHINEADLYLLAKTVTTYLNLEMATNEDILSHALKALPYKVTLVPERREEVTTEGGLDVVKNFAKVSEYVKTLKSAGIIVSIFIEADLKSLDSFVKCGADEIEIHTGVYANANENEQVSILGRMSKFIQEAKSHFRVCAGHGLHFHNMDLITEIPEIVEYNIGHSIIADALFHGLGPAVREMKKLVVGS